MTWDTHQDDGHVREAVVGVADVCKACLVKQDLLKYEGGHLMGGSVEGCCFNNFIKEHTHSKECLILHATQSTTVFESSEPLSMILRQRGMISVESRKFITSSSSVWKAL